MRVVLITLLAATAACSKANHEADAAKPVQIAFDGAAATDSAAKLRHGERLTHVLGCTGCHAAQLTGKNMLEDDPQMGTLYASNLTQVIPRYTDAQVDQILRHGVHPTRKDLWGMPSEVFQNLSDADEVALIAYLRSLQPAGNPTPPPRPSALALKAMAAGQFNTAAQMVAQYKAKPMVDLGPEYALGRYIASVTCAECHGSDLTGINGVEKDLDSPDLIVVGAYTREDFERLIDTGIPVGGRKLRLMDKVATMRLTHLTPHERDAVYAYLKARADQPQ
jgi:mono/diheme cytochrome c family protein